MQVTRSGLDTAKGPADWFTGDVGDRVFFEPGEYGAAAG